MAIALCMVVKDEANRIEACLDAALGAVDEVVIFDTGSTDGTPERILKRYGIKTFHGTLDESRCYAKSGLRNRGYELAKADWILSLDADECIEVVALHQFRAVRHSPGVSGYFGAWTNHVAGAAGFEDYKLFLFRRGFRKRGLVHENAQIDLRERGARAEWLDGLVVHHHPEAAKHPAKETLYRWRLRCAMAKEPHWTRYAWFYGYMCFQSGDFDQAERHLRACAGTEAPLFPVERLNSFMVLAELYARRSEREAALAALDAALALHERVADDFEVRINFRLAPWLREARDACARGALESVRAYRFAR